MSDFYNRETKYLWTAVSDLKGRLYTLYADHDNSKQDEIEYLQRLYRVHKNEYIRQDNLYRNTKAVSDIQELADVNNDLVQCSFYIEKHFKRINRSN